MKLILNLLALTVWGNSHAANINATSDTTKRTSLAFGIGYQAGMDGWVLTSPIIRKQDGLTTGFSQGVWVEGVIAPKYQIQIGFKTSQFSKGDSSLNSLPVIPYSGLRTYRMELGLMKHPHRSLSATEPYYGIGTGIQWIQPVY